ncbi:PepSY domain-containing protein [Litorivivens sp.]|uniref:PepSY domain-containing protein n=1 Tax=Litorivivens sp. TaxID=2020868 RepID=UPI003562B054
MRYLQHIHHLKVSLASALLAAGLTVSAPLQALPDLDRVPSLRPPTTDPSLRRNLVEESPERAVAIAEQRYNGRAVGARHLGNGVYRVRILQDDGKVKTVTVRPD